MIHLLLLGLLGWGPSIFAADQKAAAGLMDERILESVERHQGTIIEYRHRIHQNPELGNREFETSKMAAEHLRSLGMEVRTGIAHTGVVGLLTGGKPGSVVAVRADMDALPVTEDTDFPFKSTVRAVYNEMDVGVMHACGHDVHTAVLMGVASVLADLEDEIPGKVMFIFQPAEEGPPPGEEGGASLMVKEGVFDDPRPEAVFGLHTSWDMPVGKLGYVIGPALAAADSFHVTVKGFQTHGARPHQGIDPVVMAAQAVMAFQTIPSRTIEPVQPSVVSVGMIHGGERSNIIPMEVRMQGTVRTYDEQVRDTIERRMGEILDGITRAGGGSYTFQYNRGTPATINDPALSRWMVATLEAVVGEENASEIPPTMGAEDFAYYALEVPGFFYRLGTLRDGTVSGPNHSPTFRADDDSVPVGMRAMSNVVMDYLLKRAEGDKP
jgi:amidohydrolase